MSFIKGPALLKRCAGGMPINLGDFTPENLQKFIEKTKAQFLVVTEDGAGLGFAVVNPEAPQICSIHLCLRTVGKKTERAFSLIIMYIKMIMGCNTVHAVYPKEYRGCNRITVLFGFKEDLSLKTFYNITSTLPYAYKRLDI